MLILLSADPTGVALIRLEECRVALNGSEVVKLRGGRWVSRKEIRNLNSFTTYNLLDAHWAVAWRDDVGPGREGRRFVNKNDDFVSMLPFVRRFFHLTLLFIRSFPSFGASSRPTLPFFRTLLQWLIVIDVCYWRIVRRLSHLFRSLQPPPNAFHCLPNNLASSKQCLVNTLERMMV